MSLGGLFRRIGGGRKRGQHDQALGRSRGGFSTKIHLKTDFGGLPPIAYLFKVNAPLIIFGPGHTSKSTPYANKQRRAAPARVNESG